MAMKINDIQNNFIRGLNEQESINYDVYKAITDYFGISMHDAIEAVTNGNLYVSSDEVEFAEFMFEVWLTNTGLTPKEEVYETGCLLWYIYVFSNEKNYIMRFSQGHKVYHILYPEGRKNV